MRPLFRRATTRRAVGALFAVLAALTACGTDADTKANDTQTAASGSEFNDADVAPERSTRFARQVACAFVCVETHRRSRRCTASPNRATTAASRSEEHTSELQSLMRISYAVFCLKNKQPSIHSTHIST